jgi:NitT/TauT family transport system permease protein
MGRSIGGIAAARDRTLSVLALLLLWWGAAQLAADPRLLPSPGAVAEAAWRQAISGDMGRDFAATLARVLAAFLLSMLVGTVLGYGAGRSRRADAVMDPWIVILLNLPALVVIVLAYVWVGLNEVAAVLAVAVVKVPTVMVTVREGARALDPALDDLATVYGLPWTRRLRRVVLPQLAPYLAAAGRSGLAITWKIVLIVELLGRPDGVGFALNLFFQNFDVASILAYGVGFAALMLLIEMAILQPWERRANAWRRAA